MLYITYNNILHYADISKALVLSVRECTNQQLPSRQMSINPLPQLYCANVYNEYDEAVVVFAYCSLGWLYRTIVSSSDLVQFVK